MKNFHPRLAILGALAYHFVSAQSFALWILEENSDGKIVYAVCRATSIAIFRHFLAPGHAVLDHSVCRVCALKRHNRAIF